MACSLVTDPINQLEENLQCNVCLEVLKDPRTLPCCHSFCKVCLEGVVKTLRDKARRGRLIRRFPCPNCRARFVLHPDKQVADMPRNHFICNMVKATAVLDRGIGVPCSNNCSQNYSVARCVTCEKFLCRECRTDHNKYRANNGHSVLTMEELSKPENRKKIKDKMYCNEHSGMELKVYCETCDQLICRDCMDFKHVKQGHSCVLVNDVASNYKELLASNNKAMEDALIEGNAFVQRLTLMTAQLDRDAENIKTKIAQRKEFVAKKVIEMLDQKAESLCKKLDEIHKGKRANLDRQAEETKLYVENIKTSVQLSKKLVDQGSEEEIISSQKMMLDNANNLLTKREEYFKAPMPVANLSYTACAGKEPINEQILTRLANGLGDVNEGNKDTAVGDTLKIGGTELDVEQRNSQTLYYDQSSVLLGATDRSARLYQTENNYDQSEAPPRATNQSRQSKEPDESFSVSSLFLRFIIAYHYEEYQKLENVSQEISFEVSELKTYRILNFFARKNVNRNTFSKTVDEFINFYQNQNQKMHEEVIPMLPKKKNDVILEARAKFSVVIDSAQDPGKITIFGERDNVQEALNFLKSKVGVLTTSTRSNSSEFKGATGSSSSKRAAGGSSPNAKSTTGEKVLIEKLSFVLSENVKVSVYQGDITKEAVDVIVNPANENLDHSSVAAGAIVKAGGKSIQDECDAIMKRRRYYSLKPGDVVVTKAGNLPCSFIVHVVGPRWANYRSYEKDTAKKVLLNAVLNCLTVACQNSAASISIPAISSGIFGVPVPICAEILFSATTSFAKNAPKSNPLKDIRFVNIDKHTSQVFAQEMEKRFGASNHREGAELFHSNAGGVTERVDKYAQFNAWRENPKAATKATRLVYSKLDNKGSQDGKSNVNPKSPAFSASVNHSSSTPTSYSNAVARNTGKDFFKCDEECQDCSICLCKITAKKTLDKCGHSFCAGCIDEAFKHQKKCPVCSNVHGPLIGNQPPGKMFVSSSEIDLPGYELCGSITITYKFEEGIQGPEHPNPGTRYAGTTRTAYLPNNEEGNKICKLLQKAFQQKLTFIFGLSLLSGTDVITWNDIPHKTRRTGGATSFGYPDPYYLKRVQDQLAANGITE